MYTQHPDKPCEANTIEQAMQELWKCQVNGRWDFDTLNKWLKRWPDNIATAAERLNNVLDDFYKPVEVPVNERATA